MIGVGKSVSTLGKGVAHVIAHDSAISVGCWRVVKVATQYHILGTLIKKIANLNSFDRAITIRCHELIEQ